MIAGGSVTAVYDADRRNGDMEKTKETLLIVDDSRFQRTVLQKIFSQYFHIIEAASGEACFEIVKEKHEEIDLILLDLVMPEMDGFEVLCRRQQMPELKKIPVIVLTTSDTTYVQARAFELGASDFIIKPVEPAIARSRINNVLEAERRLQDILKKQETWRLKAEVDEMTHLLNKSTTEHTISHLLSTYPSEQHAMLVVDIDNFKAINDIYGHEMGDHTICVIAGTLASHSSGTDIVGRIGGDEFIVFMRNIPSKSAVHQRAQDILEAIRDKETLSIPENVTISIGIAYTEMLGSSYVSLFQKADSALSNSKKSGKQCFSEYGAVVKTDEIDKMILVYTHSRNVFSTLKFAFSHPIRVEKVMDFSDIKGAVADRNNRVVAVYIDVSGDADDGVQRWADLKEEPWTGLVSVIAVCKEGNLEQVKNAVLSGLIQDLVFEPIDMESLKRRSKLFLSGGRG